MTLCEKAGKAKEGAKRKGPIDELVNRLVFCALQRISVDLLVRFVSMLQPKIGL